MPITTTAPEPGMVMGPIVWEPGAKNWPISAASTATMATIGVNGYRGTFHLRLLAHRVGGGEHLWQVPLSRHREHHSRGRIQASIDRGQRSENDDPVEHRRDSSKVHRVESVDERAAGGSRLRPADDPKQHDAGHY